MSGWSAVILTGGRGSRLGMGEKAAVAVKGRTLLAGVLAGLPDAVPVVVVGPPMPTDREVTFTIEQPRYGGPVAAVAAGLTHVLSATVALVAVDMPDGAAVAVECVRRLVDADGDAAVVPVDAEGRRQPLCAAYRVPSLRRALEAMGDPAGRSMRELLSHLAVHELSMGAAGEALLHDIDTPEDLAGYRRRREGQLG